MAVRDRVFGGLTLAIVFALAVCRGGDGSVAIEPVFVSRSIPEYNQWLRDSGAEYPGLRPVLVAAESADAGNYRKEARVRFYGEYGDQAKTVVLTGQHGGPVQVRVPREADRLVAFQRAGSGEPRLESTTVYDARGRVLFSSGEGYLSRIDGGRYVRTFFDEEYAPYKESADVLDADGRVLRRIEPHVNGEASYSSDTTLVLQIGVGGVLVIDRHGMTLWDTAFHRPVSVGVSPRSRWLAVGTESVLVLRDLATDRRMHVKLIPMPSFGYGVPVVAFSEDEEMIAAYRPNYLVKPPVGMLEFFSSDGKRVGRPIRVSLGVVRPMPEMGFIGSRVVLAGDGEVAAVGPDGDLVSTQMPLNRSDAVFLGHTAFAVVGAKSATVYRLRAR